MLNNTQAIYERLIRGGFLAVDSTKADVRHLYQDVEENYDAYAEYFQQIGFRLTRSQCSVKIKDKTESVIDSYVVR